MNHTPSLIGQWASRDAGTLLHILSDTSALLDLSDCGEYGVIAVLHREDDALCFTSEILCGELRLTDPATLQGTCVRGRKETDVSFEKVSDRPLPHACHHAPYEEPTAVPDDFSRGAAVLTGCYHSPTLYNFYMNLADADGRLRVTLSLDGRIGFSPLSVWFEDGALVWQINDAFNRGVCTLRPADNGSLCGSYTQLGKPDKTIRFEKLSDTPRKLLTEEETVIPLPEDKSRLELLRTYAAYGSGEQKPAYTYDLDTPMPDSLRAELDALGYSDYIRGKTGDALVFACLDFMGDHFHHNGSGGCGGCGLEKILHWSAERDHQTNCRGLSLMLAALLRYNGIRAAHVTCMPYEQPFDDCHVVVDCHLPSGARVMLDPTYHLYFRDAQGEYVSLPQLSTILLTDGELIPNEDVRYTGDSSDHFQLEEYRNYMAKNTLYFNRSLHSADGMDTSTAVYLFPLSYPSERIWKQSGAIILTDETAFW